MEVVVCNRERERNRDVKIFDKEYFGKKRIWYWYD